MVRKESEIDDLTSEKLESNTWQIRKLLWLLFGLMMLGLIIFTTGAVWALKDAAKSRDKIKVETEARVLATQQVCRDVVEAANLTFIDTYDYLQNRAATVNPASAERAKAQVAELKAIANGRLNPEICKLPTKKENTNP